MPCGGLSVSSPSPFPSLHAQALKCVSPAYTPTANPSTPVHTAAHRQKHRGVGKGSALTGFPDGTAKMPTPVKHPHMIEGLPGGAGYEMGYYPFNRHTLNNNPAAAKGSIQRSRVVVKGGRRMKVPIALRERPDWTYSGAAQSQLLRGNYADIRNRDTAVREMTLGRNIEARLRAAFGLSRCSQAKENREVLAKTPGLVEAVGHVLMHAEPSESGKRCAL